MRNACLQQLKPQLLLKSTTNKFLVNKEIDLLIQKDTENKNIG